LTTPRVRPHVARILDQTHTVLIASNAICELFTQEQTSLIAQNIRDQLLAEGHKMSLLTYIDGDPLSMLAYAHSRSPADGANAEQIIRDAELSAATTATITPGAPDVLQACLATHRRLAVVSVNCLNAVETYLDMHDLRRFVESIFGREDIAVTSWDSATDLVRKTVETLGDEPARCTVVGLSVAAMYAARQAGTHGIGVVNKHANRKHLASFDAVVVSSLPDLAAAITAIPRAQSPR
jgi:beta-phosphoglucomutase-like phosphatase (HAD superfamily)